MRGEDFKSMMDDVADVLQDVGTVDDMPNVQWLHREHDTYDKLYREDTKKSFTPYMMCGVIFMTRPRDAVTQTGLDVTIDTKVLISPKEFARYQIKPHVADRLVVDGVMYNVGGDDKSLIPVRFGGYGVVYMIKIVSATSPDQTVEAVEEQDPYANHQDASKDPEDANTSGVNDPIYDKFQAVAVSTVSTTVVITSDRASLSMKYNGGSEDVITLTPGVFNLAGLATALTTEAQNIFGPGTVRAVVNPSGYLQIESLLVGPEVSFEITATETMHHLLGIEAKIYQGYQRLRITESGDYINGVPVRG